MTVKDKVKDFIFGDAHPLDALDDSDVPGEEENGTEDEEDEEDQDARDPDQIQDDP